MTKEQINEFNKWGCESRCIIQLTERAGIPITIDEFCARYEKSFPDPIKHYGILTDGARDGIIHKLGLANTFRRRQITTLH